MTNIRSRLELFDSALDYFEVLCNRDEALLCALTDRLDSDTGHALFVAAIERYRSPRLAAIAVYAKLTKEHNEHATRTEKD